jgi:Holliday junction resolvasome RuvABC ATP-dependent DNA helicase subunit
MTGKMMIAIASTTHPDYVSVQPHSEFSRLVKMGIYKDAAKLKKLSRAERIQARAIAAKRAEEFAQESRQTSVG